jgi:hypothetical protein
MSSPTSVVLQQADYDKKVKESQSQENASRRKAYAFSLCVDAFYIHAIFYVLHIWDKFERTNFKNQQPIHLEI